MYVINKIWNPGVYQGKFKRGRYFEGWYFKIIDRDSRNIFALIPGVAMGEKGKDAHAFVQVSDARWGKAYYFRYLLSCFSSSCTKFAINIAGNSFSSEGIHIDLNSADLKLKGDLLFSNIVRFPKNFLNPGIMGPFSFVPFMECYHDVINMHHEITGVLFVNGVHADFTGGYGYIEKDWGRSFPEAWVWLQSNHFENDDASIMFSLAKIPWLGRHFTGLISYLRLGDRFYRFATYTGARVLDLSISSDNVSASLEGNGYNLSIFSRNNGGNILKAPKNGFMATEINESITSEVTATLRDREGNVVFSGLGRNTGLEIAGDTSVLM